MSDTFPAPDNEPAIAPTVPPTGTGCVECLEAGGWWLHLRRCARCGHIGCCDNSPSQHATGHAQTSGHPIIRSFEPGEDWFWTTGPTSSSLVLIWPPPNTILWINRCPDRPGEFPGTGRVS